MARAVATSAVLSVTAVTFAAIAASADAVLMSEAFKAACEAGRKAYKAGLAIKSTSAKATSPMEAFLKEAMK